MTEFTVESCLGVPQHVWTALNQTTNWSLSFQSDGFIDGSIKSFCGLPQTVWSLASLSGYLFAGLLFCICFHCTEVRVRVCLALLS